MEQIKRIGTKTRALMRETDKRTLQDKKKILESNLQVNSHVFLYNTE